jgi:Domain of unknown function (DUF4352)
MSEQQFSRAQNQPYGQPPYGQQYGQQQYGQQYAPTDTQPAPPGPPWQHPASPRKRSWFARHKVITGIGILVAIFVIIGVASGGGSPAVSSSGGSNETSNETSNDAPNGTSSGESATGAKIGTPVRDGKFEFTVTKVRCGVPSVGPEGLEQAAQGQFCLVSLKVTNIGDKPQTLDASSQYGYDGQNRKLNADGAAGILANPAGGGAFLNDINPGNSANAVVVFDIPKNGKLTKLELHDSPFSGGVDVSVG